MRLAAFIARAKLAALLAGGFMLCGCLSNDATVGPGLIETPRFAFELDAPMTRIWPGVDPEVAANQLTRHGPLLDRLFVASLADGKGLVTPGFEDYPRWWASTPADGLEAFLSESLTALGYENVRVTAMDEHAFGTEPGVLYRLDLERPGGLEISGLALAAVKGEVLDLLLFVAPSAHYFEHRRAETHALFASVRRPATEPERRRAGTRF
jgi:hypothetical protein